MPASQAGEAEASVPVFVMLPLDTVLLIDRDDGSQVSVLKKEKDLEAGLVKLRQAGVEGVMVDVWWGIAERSPGAYDFSAYERLFQKVGAAGLKIQAVMSFHAAGGNVGDTCNVPLPRWVLELGDANPDIFYTDRAGFRNRECLSLGCDELALFHGRSPVQMYADFVSGFADVFSGYFGTYGGGGDAEREAGSCSKARRKRGKATSEMGGGLAQTPPALRHAAYTHAPPTARHTGNMITEVTVGLGPAGELRYPSYPEGDGRWRFPGVGEFQCYDRYMLADLQRAAAEAGQPEWCVLVGRRGGRGDG